MFDDNALCMNFEVSYVLGMLLKNRNQHKEIVKEAEEGYKKKFEEELLNKLSELRSGNVPSSHSKLVRPTSHLNKYDSAIAMVQSTTDKTIKLTQEQFECYALDQWNWKNEFLNTNSYYSVSAANEVNNIKL